MKKSTLAITLLMAVSSSTSAQDKKDSDFLQDVIGPRVQECKAHFDVEPFVLVALGLDQDERVTEEVHAALESFGKTGRIVLPANKQNDAKAVSCATYAEGLLAGGIGAQLIVTIKMQMGQAVGKVMNSFAEGLKAAVESLGKAISDAIQQGIDLQKK